MHCTAHLRMGQSGVGSIGTMAGGGGIASGDTKRIRWRRRSPAVFVCVLIIIQMAVSPTVIMAFDTVSRARGAYQCDLFAACQRWWLARAYVPWTRRVGTYTWHAVARLHVARQGRLFLGANGTGSCP